MLVTCRSGRPCRRTTRLVCIQVRALTAPSATVSDGDIARLSNKPPHPLTLRDLVKHGRPPLSPSQVYHSANFALSILPTRLAHRIRSLRNLPFIVVTNPNVAQIHNNYIHSLSTLLPLAETIIDTVEKENQFTEVMSGLVHTHASTIPILARGFLESRKYMSAPAITAFLDEHLRARIGTRLIAEQHIALHYSSQKHLQHNKPTERAAVEQSSYIGIIDTALKPSTIIKNCEAFVSDICELQYGVRPTVIINGEPEARMAYVPVHLEYIITELLKNAFRATIERGNERNPIEITIAPAPELTPSLNDADGSVGPAEKKTSANGIQPLDIDTPGVTIRIRDQGGGIGPEHLKDIWNYSFTTFDEREASGAAGGTDALNIISGASAGGSSLAGLGYGLPLSRAYAEYFGGGIAVQSLWGWGTDVYLSLRGIGKIDWAEA